MKKALSLFLAIMMIFSSFAVINVNAAENGGLADMLYDEQSIAAAQDALKHLEIKNLPERFNDFNEFRNSEAWDKVSLFGISLDFLYSDTAPLVWSNLDTFLEVDGKLVYGSDGLPVKLISMDDISLAYTNLGVYLHRFFYDQYGGLKLYTVENAIALTNIIGKMLYPDFVKLDIANYKNYFKNETPTTNEFFRAITTLSGLDKVIEHNWVPRGKSFSEPLVSVLTGHYIDFSSEFYSDGLILGSKILEGILKKLITEGPVKLFTDLINVFSSVSYETTYREPTLALFTHKIASISDYMTERELNSFDGLLKLVFCDDDCFTATGSTGKFCPLTFPKERYHSTTDENEKFIYLYYYFNLCGRYRDNRYYFENFKKTLNSSKTISAGDKKKLTALIDGFFLGDINSAVDNAIVPLYKENISTAKDTIFDRIRNAFMTLMKKIADYFDYLRKIFSGELDYGQGNSPFN